VKRREEAGTGHGNEEGVEDSGALLGEGDFVSDDEFAIKDCESSRVPRDVRIDEGEVSCVGEGF
jgi:hypothetical protein